MIIVKHLIQGRNKVIVTTTPLPDSLTLDHSKAVQQKQIITKNKILPIFRPPLGEEQKKGLHSNLVRFLAQN